LLRLGGASQVDGGSPGVAEILQCLAHQCERIAVRIRAIRQRPERGYRGRSIAQPPLSGGQKLQRLPVRRLQPHQPLQPQDRLLDAARLIIDRAGQQHAGRLIVECAAGSLVERLRELEIAGSRGEHRLEKKGHRIGGRE
jgi:hypothetical protein